MLPAKLRILKHPLLFTACFAVAASAGIQPAVAELIFLDLPDRRIEVSYVGDIEEQAVAIAAIRGASNQSMGELVTVGDATSNAFALASNEIIFKAHASANSSSGAAGGSASATGGEVIVLDLRTSDVIPTSLQGWFNLDGNLSYSVALGPPHDPNNQQDKLGFAGARFDWQVASLFGGAGFALGNGISSNTNNPPSGSYAVP